MKYSIKKRHISIIKAGDTIICPETGNMKTVCNNNIKNSGMLTLFGDSYHLGYKPVELVLISL